MGIIRRPHYFVNSPSNEYPMNTRTYPDSAPNSTKQTAPSRFVAKRGTNLSHWLSQDFKWHPRAQWITRNDIRFIAREGFDHVRLPVDESELWNEDNTRNEAAFALMRNAVDWAREAGLRVILDLHILRSHNFNAENEGGRNTLFSDNAEQEHLANLWRDLSSAVGDVPNDELAYEIMNEPVADKHEDWNYLVAKTVHSIRETEPGRMIVIGANRWQIARSFPHLKVPENDRNILLSFHAYAPIILTHYKADWTPFRSYDGPVNYPGMVVSEAACKDFESRNGSGIQFLDEGMEKGTEIWNRERIEKEFEPAITKARGLGLDLYCGEFGCLPSVPRASRLNYYRDMVDVLEKNGIGWAIWEYKGDYGIYEWRESDKHCGTPDADLLEILTGA